MNWKYFILLLCLLLAVADAKQRPRTRRPKPAAAGRPAELRGSKEQRIQQNTKAISLGISQILTDGELLSMEDNNILIKLVDTEHYAISRGAAQARKLRRGKKIITCPIKENKVLIRRYTRSYVNSFARDFFLEFGKKLKVTSGARSLEEQALMRTKGSCTYNPNAAIAGDPLEESLHVRALAFDVSRRVIAVVKGKLKEVPMSGREIAWMRKRLIADKYKDVDFEEKEQGSYSEIETLPIEENACYHIVVFPR